MYLHEKNIYLDSALRFYEDLFTTSYPNFIRAGFFTCCVAIHEEKL